MIRPVLALSAVLCLLAGCGRGGKTEELTAKMGEPVKVGTLSYVATETEWLDHLGEGAAAKVPEHRFLAVRISITNGGVRRSIVPATELLDQKGTAYAEVADIAGVSDWLGAFRAVDPASTEHGVLVFDVPVGAYRLRVSDDTDMENQKTALIILPYQTPPLVPRPDSVVPGGD